MTVTTPVISFSKTSKNARLPQQAHQTDTGYDVYSIADTVIPAKGSAVVPIGLKFTHIEPGYWVRIATRSGHGFKRSLMVFPGVIDEGYRGDASVKVFNLSDTDQVIPAGERFAQFIVHKRYDVKMVWSEEVTETSRGDGGFNSTGLT